MENQWTAKGGLTAVFKYRQDLGEKRHVFSQQVEEAEGDGSWLCYGAAPQYCLPHEGRVSTKMFNQKQDD